MYFILNLYFFFGFWLTLKFPFIQPFQIPIKVRFFDLRGHVDAVVDLNASDGFRTMFGEKRKDVRLIASDFVFGSIGNAGRLSFGKNPFLLESIGAGVSVFPTDLGNKVVNDIIGN